MREVSPFASSDRRGGSSCDRMSSGRFYFGQWHKAIRVKAFFPCAFLSLLSFLPIPDKNQSI
nr:TPA_asm: m28 uoORF [Murid betaherpesvirus 1]DBA07952.1 TPA_asm: m28 uoORF [Murid betaherpesvirus 1]